MLEVSKIGRKGHEAQKLKVGNLELENIRILTQSEQAKLPKPLDRRDFLSAAPASRLIDMKQLGLMSSQVASDKLRNVKRV